MDEVTGHVDIVPTVLEFCGLPVPQGVQGKSLAPLCAGNSAGWPNEAFSWMLGVPYTRQEAYMLGRKRMLRTPEFKLIDYGVDFRMRWALYDMAKDPAEMHNLAGRSCAQLSFSARWRRDSTSGKPRHPH